MKRIVLILALVFGSVWSEEPSDSQWKNYFGVEGGVGAMSFCPAFFGFVQWFYN